ncbi:MAG: UTP--glucose-1-phosphate uridylyltransferase GalU [Ruminococcaceae bacterium]|nr:UTP--glucose-1-phosphate uridylyltransferase GalU [Oscillospiraceae bacterium]
MKVRKAVIPAAGLGTRMLPAAKAVPKEMMPIVDKPAMHYQIEEAVASGITDILIITNRGKESIEDYFDYSPEYERHLEMKGKAEELEALRSIANMANITFIRQKEAKGLGHAVLCAKEFIGNEPFAVLYGDDLIESDTPTTKKLVEIYEKYQKGAVGVSLVLPELIHKYCSLKVEAVEERIFSCTDMVEKPSPDKVMSYYSILGRVVMPPEIFGILESIGYGYGGELQLTDAMGELARRKGVMAYDFPGTHHDMGSKLGLLKANVTYGAKHGEIGEEFRAWLKKFVSEELL